MHRRVRGFWPAFAGAAFSGDLGLPWLPRMVVMYDRGRTRLPSALAAQECASFGAMRFRIRLLAAKWNAVSGCVR
jgi:hypothetical protein